MARIGRVEENGKTGEGNTAAKYRAARYSISDAIGQYLWKTNEFGLKESGVLIILTDEEGEIAKKDVEIPRAKRQPP
ncbi:MAG: hypothetical protein NTY64_09460 [Deltaproteobacteria bacterium]|nr:hypothetical protein [Deltaproteobacteria bacterium]